jgi:hypothetical protein
LLVGIPINTATGSDGSSGSAASTGASLPELLLGLAMPARLAATAGAQVVTLNRLLSAVEQ